MDWNAVIERNREALKRVLAMLAAMAGAAHLSPPIAGEKAKSTSWRSQVLDFARGGIGSPVTLPRHLHRAVLRLLRPAEAAARRLIIITAVSSRFAEGKSVVPVARWKAGERRDAAKQRGPGRKGTAGDGGGGMARSYPTRLALPLTDPLPRWRRARPVPPGVPRISLPGIGQPFSVPPPPAPDDRIDAGRLVLRLAAVASALDDLPRHARRFARWHARNEAAIRDRAAGRPSRFRRFSALRPGGPPGQPSARGRRPAHEVHEVLADMQWFARRALAPPDTS